MTYRVTFDESDMRFPWCVTDGVHVIAKFASDKTAASFALHLRQVGRKLKRVGM